MKTSTRKTYRLPWETPQAVSRRLGKELERVGKVWKDKLLRIEPAKVEQEVGSKYYYISDKMKVVTETEKGTPTSHIRYLAGNYFTTHMAATQMLGKINDLIREIISPLTNGLRLKTDKTAAHLTIPVE